METKQCKTCGEVKSISLFHAAKGGAFGKRGSCAACCNLATSIWEKNLSTERKQARNRKKSERIKTAESMEKTRQRKRRNFLARYYGDPDFKLARRMRERMRKALNGMSKSETTQSLLGCSLAELKVYLESLWDEGMNWDNYGLYGWHIDHIKPCALFNLSKEEEQKACFHYTNLQPLWAKDNLRKGKTPSGPPQTARS